MPKSLYGRLVLLLATGFTVALLLSSVVDNGHREAISRRVLSWQAGQRTVDLVQMLRALPEAARAPALAAMTDRRFHPELRLTPPTGTPLTDTTGRILHRVVQQRLGSTEGWRFVSGGRQGRLVAVSMGPEWLVVRLNFWHPRFAWPSRFVADLALLTLTLALASWFAVRSITRPLARLATAAGRLGENLRQEPLSETGPTEVRQAAEAFNTMQDQLLRHFEARSRMVAAMSHDLRTPLTRMRLRTEMLEEAAIRERFERDLIEMEGIVNDTLSMMRSLHSSEAEAEFDLVALLSQLVRDRVECGQDVRFACADARLTVRGKQDALKRCVENLVENAVKYAGAVVLSAQAQDRQVVITAVDDGPGIPEQDLERVFEPFYRIESSRSRETGGTGLGLSITRDLAHTFGARVRLRNRSPRGLEASITLRA